MTTNDRQIRQFFADELLQRVVRLHDEPASGRLSSIEKAYWNGWAACRQAMQEVLRQLVLAGDNAVSDALQATMKEYARREKKNRQTITSLQAEVREMRSDANYWQAYAMLLAGGSFIVRQYAGRPTHYVIQGKNTHRTTKKNADTLTALGFVPVDSEEVFA